MARCESHSFPLAWNQFVREKARRTNDPNYARTHRANYHLAKDGTSPSCCSCSCCSLTKCPGIPITSSSSPRNQDLRPQLAAWRFILWNSNLA